MHRRITHRTRGHTHGPITRLASPSDLGQVLKPFVFLDLIDIEGAMLRAMAGPGGGFPLHPHSGIATVTVLTRGHLRFDDPVEGTGLIGPGGVEWMRAGNGVWHGKELSVSEGVTHVQGFQLWLALPPALENGPPESRYIEAADMPRTGPAHVIVGEHEGARSPVVAPPGIHYLLVTLPPGERWSYQPPAGCTVGWLALAEGTLDAGSSISAGELVVFEEGEAMIALQSVGAEAARFVLGCAVPHDHPLHLGMYSVHTTAAALVQGERRIEALRRRLMEMGERRTASGTVPVLRSSHGGTP